MKLNDAILKSLDDIAGLANHKTIHKHIVDSEYYDFKDAETPILTISALLGRFIEEKSGDVKKK